MRVLIVSATPFEIAPLQLYVSEHFEQTESAFFKKGELELRFLITGVGMTATAYALGKSLKPEAYELVINAGIAGAFRERGRVIGEVVNVRSERFGDLGAETAEGDFLDIQQLELQAPDAFPFTKGRLVNPTADSSSFLPLVDAVTVNRVHGNEASIQQFRQRLEADIESMEGAAFFYACLQDQLPFMQIRAISNFVEARDRNKWDIPLAIQSLNKVLQEMVDGLVG